MGSSKKSKDKDREKNREEKKKRKHRSRSRSKERERHHRHKHKKRSHKRDHHEQQVAQQRSRSRSPLSDVSDQSSDNEVSLSAQENLAAPPPPRISRHSPHTPPPPAPKRGQKRGHEEGAIEATEERNSSSSSSSKRGRDTATSLGGGWEDGGGSQPPPPTTSSSGGDGGKGSGSGGSASMSLSVEETNRIRAKLGLKPLQVQGGESHAAGGEDGEEEDEGPPLQPGEKRMKEDSQEFIHKPASNLRDKLQVEKLREKIAAQREKRRLKEKLSKVKTLGDSDSEDDALAWVNKNRKLTKEREEAEKKAAQLEEMDALFGVGDLVEEEVAKDQRRAYGRNHLSGLKVQHSHTRFGAGMTILTLADADVLANDEDTLVNVNIVDQEIAERNIERRRKKVDEVEYEAPSMDNSGGLTSGNMLSKYDEELQGPTMSSFRLGRKGHAVVEDDGLQGLGEKQRKLAKLRQMHSLSSTDNQLVSEYMTHDEAAATFRKPKKLRKKKKKMLKADDLVPLEDSEQHLGSRTSMMEVAGRGTRSERGQQEESVGDPANRVKSLRELMEEDGEEGSSSKKMELDGDNYGDDDGEDGINDDIELQEALARSRKAKLAKLRQPKVEDLREMLEASEPLDSSRPVSLSDLLPDSSRVIGGSQQHSVSAMDTDEGLVVTLNTTDEFCRTLGDLPTYGLSGNRAADEEANGQQQLLNKAPVESAGASGAWEEVGIDDSKVEISESQSVPILDEEPDAARGVANALRLAIKKGYLEKDTTSKKGNAALQHLRAINYSIDDKAGDDDRRGRGGGDRYSGPVTEFREKDGYKPKISLEYVDDEGRKLCPKEAFRYLSHKFHGKGSGKNKTEKRMKKWNEELLMKQMSSSDTPLQTLERQIDKQKQLGTSYLLLSGSKNQEPAAATETRIRK